MTPPLVRQLKCRRQGRFGQEGIVPKLHTRVQIKPVRVRRREAGRRLGGRPDQLRGRPLPSVREHPIHPALEPRRNVFAQRSAQAPSPTPSIQNRASAQLQQPWIVPTDVVDARSQPCDRSELGVEIAAEAEMPRECFLKRRTQLPKA